MFDLHWPEVDEGTWACCMKVVKDLKARKLLKGFVFGGDQFNNRMINPHIRGKHEEQRSSFIRTVKDFEKKILDPLDAELEPISGAVKVWILGNHEDWERQLVLEEPKWRGFESHLQLNLRERGWRVVPCGTIWRYGKLNFFHGEWLSGINHPVRALEMVDGNCIYGHFHTMKSATKILSYRHRQKWQAQSMPIGGRVNAEWVRNAPNGWINGFGVTEFREGGNFAHYPITVFDGTCSYGGRVYGGA